MPWLRPRADGVSIDIFVQPRASRNEIVGLQGEELKIRLTSPPVEGAANRLCIEFFSGLLHVPKREIVLLAGETSRHKRLLFRGADPEAIRETLSAHIPGP